MVGEGLGDWVGVVVGEGERDVVVSGLGELLRLLLSTKRLVNFGNSTAVAIAAEIEVNSMRTIHKMGWRLMEDWLGAEIVEWAIV